MKKTRPSDDQLRAQIEATSAEHYPSDAIEDRIATSLLETGRFHGWLNARDLADVLRNLVYTIFSHQQFGGRDINLVHNVPKMRVAIKKHQADVHFLVHIHRPIIAFLSFTYSLLNDPVAAGKNLRIKHGSLQVEQDTRRFDVKAKAVLAAVDIYALAQQQLADPAAIILSTLPPQLKKRGARGAVDKIDLFLHEKSLEVCLEGSFEELAPETSHPAAVS